MADVVTMIDARDERMLADKRRAALDPIPNRPIQTETLPSIRWDNIPNSYAGKTRQWEAASLFQVSNAVETAGWYAPAAVPYARASHRLNPSTRAAPSCAARSFATTRRRAEARCRAR